MAITPSDVKVIADAAKKIERDRLKRIVARLAVLYHNPMVAQLERHFLKEAEEASDGMAIKNPPTFSQRVGED